MQQLRLLSWGETKGLECAWGAGVQQKYDSVMLNLPIELKSPREEEQGAFSLLPSLRCLRTRNAAIRASLAY